MSVFQSGFKKSRFLRQKYLKFVQSTVNSQPNFKSIRGRAIDWVRRTGFANL